MSYGTIIADSGAITPKKIELRHRYLNFFDYICSVNIIFSAYGKRIDRKERGAKTARKHLQLRQKRVCCRIWPPPCGKNLFDKGIFSQQIVCASATTWMRDKLFGNKGGLYNRMTNVLYLSPFSLAETEEYLQSRSIAFNRYQILETYMILGGIPLYLSMLEKELSLAQNIDQLFFATNAKLKSEYKFLFSSLFRESTVCKNIVKLLAKKASGMTRQEIIEALKLSTGGKLSTMLNDLIDSDFIRPYTGLGKKERETVYQLCDLFTLFYLRYVASYTGNDIHHWSNMTDSPSKRAWSGYAFEQVCFHHIKQIKAKLGISGIESNVYSYRNTDFQIDMLIDRRDQVINLCEMKFSLSEFEIDKQYDEHLRRRRELFRNFTSTKKSLYITMITTYGIKQNIYSGDVQSEVTGEDLFER
jgi:hypothetical protein